MFHPEATMRLQPDAMLQRMSGGHVGVQVEGRGEDLAAQEAGPFLARKRPHWKGYLHLIFLAEDSKPHDVHALRSEALDFQGALEKVHWQIEARRVTALREHWNHVLSHYWLQEIKILKNLREKQSTCKGERELRVEPSQNWDIQGESKIA